MKIEAPGVEGEMCGKCEAVFSVNPQEPEAVRLCSKHGAVDELIAALAADGNLVGTYTLLDWCADRLSIVADGNADRLGLVESQREIVAWLRSKGAIARKALAAYEKAVKQ